MTRVEVPHREITLDELFSKRHNRIPVITVERDTGRVLGLNVTDRAAFDRTVSTEMCHYFDPVNDCIYLKGEHSREIERIREIRMDCCHARRHELHLLYLVTMDEGHCMFGMSDCHFYRFQDDRFVLDGYRIVDGDAARTCGDRIATLLETEEDREHMKRFCRSRPDSQG